MKTIIAIDPGVSGGFAVRHQTGDVEARQMPATQGDILDYLREICAAAGANTDAFIEDVPKFCGPKLPGSTIGVMFENYGFIKGVIMAFGIRTHLVRPQEWQKSFSLGTARSCGSKTVWKNKLKGEAQRLFPQLRPTLKTADAILILEHGIRKTA